MAKKTIGIILLLVAGLITAILFTYGGPIFPHITGPIILGTIGVFLLIYKRKVA